MGKTAWAFLGIVVGSLLTGIAGPIAVLEYKYGKKSFDWSGDWYSIVCSGGNSYHWIINFKQEGSNASGGYYGYRDTDPQQRGNFKVESVVVNSITGNYLHLSGDQGGLFHFVALEDDKFQGTGRRDNKTPVTWNGWRNSESVEECS